MPVFSYTALDAVSRRVSGVVQADSPRQARALLLGQGVRPTKLADVPAEKQRLKRPLISSLAIRLLAMRQREQVVDAFENLLTLLESHVPLEEAWSSLVRQTGGRKSRKTPTVLCQIHDGVRLGRPMSLVMTENPHHFDSVDVALVKAGEDSGELVEALARFVARRQTASKLVSTFVAALAYPLFLVVFGMGVVAFLTTTVLPNLNTMLVAAGGQVPWPTRALVAVGHVVATGAIPVLLTLLLLVILASRRGTTLHKTFTGIGRKIPVVGTALHHWQLAQFCLVLKTLVASGIHLPQALVLAGQASGEGSVAKAALSLRDQILEGHDLEDGDMPASNNQIVANGQGFPPWLWRALGVGQAAGDLVPVLDRVGKRFETQAAKSASKLAAVLEPAMILTIGAAVGTVAYAAILPIIRLGGAW
jgi:general secretion pathway protein F